MLSTSSKLPDGTEIRCPSLKSLKFLKHRNFVRFMSLQVTFEYFQELHARNAALIVSCTIALSISVTCLFASSSKTVNGRAFCCTCLGSSFQYALTVLIEWCKVCYLRPWWGLVCHLPWRCAPNVIWCLGLFLLPDVHGIPTKIFPLWQSWKKFPAWEFSFAGWACPSKSCCIQWIYCIALLLPPPSSSPILLRCSCNSTFMGSRCSIEVSHKLILLGSGDFLKCSGNCLQKWEHRIKVSLSLLGCQSCKKASTE